MECVALDPKDTTKVTLTHTLSEDKKSLVHSVDITRILNGAIAGIAGGNNVKETVPAVVIMGGSTTYTLAGLKGFELKFNHSLATGREVLTLNSDKKAIDLKCSDVK